MSRFIVSCYKNLGKKNISDFRSLSCFSPGVCQVILIIIMIMIIVTVIMIMIIVIVIMIMI